MTNINTTVTEIIGTVSGAYPDGITGDAIGTGPNDIVRLDPLGRLPAVDGSQLTGVSGAGDLVAANNLSDLVNATTARGNLGLGNVNNTSDANKPISTAAQSALDAKQPIDAQLTSVAALSYTGNSLKVMRVNAGETDFELVTPSAAPSAFRGAVLYSGLSNQSIPVNTTTAIIFENATVNTDGIFTGAFLSRLTVPAGVTKIRLSGQIAYASGTVATQRRLAFNKNGSDLTTVLPVVYWIMDGTNPAVFQVDSPVLVVTAGDYFELVTYQTDATPQDAVALYLWFTMEIAE